MIMPLRHTQLLPGTLQNLFYPPAKEDNYTYFSRRMEKPFPTNGALVKAAWAADAAMLAYARCGAERMSDAQFAGILDTAGLTAVKTIGNWGAGGTQGYFASNNQFAILAFRGTEADDPDDLFTDANLVLWPEKDYCAGNRDPGPGAGHLSFFGHAFSLPCLVHLGFQRALDSVWAEVWDNIEAYRKDHPGKEIGFTGHSLGAALALLAFSRFAYPEISLYTFGCPRVGNAAFRERTMSYPGRGVYRFVNDGDAVTHVPFDGDRYAYCQTPTESYHITANGEIDRGDDSFAGDLNQVGRAFASLYATVSALQMGMKQDLRKIPAPDSFVDHSPARYCFRLWDCV